MKSSGSDSRSTDSESRQDLLCLGRDTVLHVTEAWGGGVQTAIEAYVANAPFVNHLVLAKARVGDHGPSKLSPSQLRVISASAPLFLVRAARIIWDSRPRVVHLHSSFAGLLRAIPLGVRTIYTPHCYGFERSDLPRAALAAVATAERLLANRSRVAAVSPREMGLATSMGNPNSVLLPNVSQFSSASSDYVPGLIVAAGRLSDQKDPMLFAEVAARLGGDGLKFLWVGGGDERLKRSLVNAGVEVTGWVEHAKAVELIGRAEIYVHTARWEGAPIALLEAAALRRPILARELKAYEGTAICQLKRDPDLFAQRIRAVLTDRGRRQHLLAISENLSVAHTAEIQSAVLADLYG